MAVESNNLVGNALRSSFSVATIGRRRTETQIQMQTPVGCTFERLFNKSSAANHDEYGQGDKHRHQTSQITPGNAWIERYSCSKDSKTSLLTTITLRAPSARIACTASYHETTNQQTRIADSTRNSTLRHAADCHTNNSIVAVLFSDYSATHRCYQLAFESKN